ncbi:sugar/nucleoside kinase (ribokinase family) [Fontibacillus solani]|uniref:Sugar/nucleoside kinase (Ribokinase family) n=1 Tax=Fontibacillus solani TaxID=1572857 RepID=A0A7W3XT07_9BACL|nr:sugar/nucleoside kinase (ribokinase family) [Fontibacillus solani]
MANILVVGSMNMDIVTQVDRHPFTGRPFKPFLQSFFIM